jgi:hypothetical protein
MPDLAYAEDATPAEIAAVLHEHIARTDPVRAALVAAFGQIPRKPGYPLRRARQPAGGRSAARLRRLEVYTALRLSGTGKKAAARQAGISHHTGRQYEADLIASLGGGA